MFHNFFEEYYQAYHHYMAGLWQETRPLADD
jgi:hypothetical protein